MAELALMRPPPRLVARLSLDYVLLAVRLVSDQLDGDILGGLTVFALLQGKYAQLAARPRGATADIPARAVSVQSLARSLKTPPETMRRCVARLIARGWCERIAGRGIVLAETPEARAKIERLMTGTRRAFCHLMIALKQIGFDFDLMDHAVEHTEAPLAVADAAVAETSRSLNFPEESSPALDRAILDFGLRMVDAGTANFGDDYVLTCVFSAIMSANASPIAYDAERAWRYGTYDTPPPDDVRRRVSLSEVSQILGIPYETARRYVQTLIARGLCERDARKTLMIPMEIVQTPQGIQVGLEIMRRFVQMLGEVKRLGFDFRTLSALPSGPPG